MYFGTKHWTKAKTLYDALEIPEEIKSYVNDYRINLIEVAYLTPEQIELFHSDFRLIADFFVQKRISGEYIPPDVSIRHMDAFLKLLSIMVGDQRYEEILDELDNRSDKKGEIKMCEIYDQILNKGIEKGIEQERINSEKKIQEANKRAEAAEEELRRIKKQFALQ